MTKGDERANECFVFSSDERLDDKIVVHPVERVKIKEKEFLARVDTGATRCSICKSVVKKLELGPVIDKVEVRNAHGLTKRDILLIDVELAGLKKKIKFNVSDRTSMKYPILIGRDLLKGGFLVDCSNENWYN